jgi:hypothetical protein
MNATEECRLDVAGIEQWSVSFLLDENKELRLSFNVGHQMNSLATIGMAKTTLQWAYLFPYLFNLLCKNSSCTKFVEAGKA